MNQIDVRHGVANLQLNVVKRGDTQNTALPYLQIVGARDSRTIGHADALPAALNFGVGFVVNDLALLGHALAGNHNVRAIGQGIGADPGERAGVDIGGEGIGGILVQGDGLAEPRQTQRNPHIESPAVIRQNGGQLPGRFTLVSGRWAVKSCGGKSLTQRTVPRALISILLNCSRTVLCSLGLFLQKDSLRLNINIFSSPYVNKLPLRLTELYHLSQSPRFP